MRVFFKEVEEAQKEEMCKKLEEGVTVRLSAQFNSQQTHKETVLKNELAQRKQLRSERGWRIGASRIRFASSSWANEQGHPWLILTAAHLRILMRMMMMTIMMAQLLGLWVQNTRGGWIVFFKVVANFSQSVSAPVRVACSWLQTVSSSDLADWFWLGRM